MFHELRLTVRLTDGREFENVNSLAVSEFIRKTEHHVTRLTRLFSKLLLAAVNYCY